MAAAAVGPGQTTSKIFTTRVSAQDSQHSSQSRALLSSQQKRPHSNALGQRCFFKRCAPIRAQPSNRHQPKPDAGPGCSGTFGQKAGIRHSTWIWNNLNATASVHGTPSSNSGQQDRTFSPLRSSKATVASTGHSSGSPLPSIPRNTVRTGP